MNVHFRAALLELCINDVNLENTACAIKVCDITGKNLIPGFAEYSLLQLLIKDKRARTGKTGKVLKLDEEWRRSLPRRYKIFYLLVGGLTSWLMGY